MDRKALVAAFAGFLLLSVLLYGNTAKWQFVYDDVIFIQRPELTQATYLLTLWQEPYVKDAPQYANYRPVAIFSFALNAIFGLHPAGFHVVNVLLYGLLLFAVFLLVYRLFRRVPLAMIVALLFAVFPIHTEVVASVKSRDEILALLFSLLSWLLFIRAEESLRRRTRFLAGSAVLLLLGLLSKETVFLMPILFVLVAWVRRKLSWPLVGQTVLAFTPVLVLYLLLRILTLGEYAFEAQNVHWVSNPLQDASYAVRFWTAMKLLFLYVRKTFLPYDLSATYYYNHLPLVTRPWQTWEVLAGGMLFAALLIIIARRSIRWRWPELSVGALVFFIPYLFVSNLLFVGGALFAERLAFVPSLGLGMMAGLGIEKLSRWRRSAAFLALFALLGVYSAVTVARSAVWRDNEALFQSMKKDSPQSMQGYFNLGVVRFTQQNIHEAKTYAEQAAQIYADDPELFLLRGKIALIENNLEDAERYFLEAVRGSPRTSDPYFYYALALAKREKYEESFTIARQAFQQFPDNPQVRFLMAVNLFKLGRTAEAETYFDWNPALSREEKIRLLEEF